MQIYIVQVISAFFASMGLAMIFSVSRKFKHIIIGASIGATGWVTYLIVFNNTDLGIYFAYFAASLVVGFSSEIMARLNKAPATIFTLTGIFPLVPGGLIYKTMLYAFEGKIDLFISSFVETIGISIVIALAILFSNTFFKLKKQIKINNQCENK